MSKRKFTIDKKYTVTIMCEGIDINEATASLCIFLETYNIVIPMIHENQNSFSFALPKLLIGMKNTFNYAVHIVKDNLFFEVLKDTFSISAPKLIDVTMVVDDDSSIEQKILPEQNNIIESQPEIVETIDNIEDVSEICPIINKNTTFKLIGNF